MPELRGATIPVGVRRSVVKAWVSTGSRGAIGRKANANKWGFYLLKIEWETNNEDRVVDCVAILHYMP